MVRLKCNCRDCGFVVASLRGLLGGRKQYKQKFVNIIYIYICIYVRDVSYPFSQKVVRCKGRYGGFVIGVVRLK